MHAISQEIKMASEIFEMNEEEVYHELFENAMEGHWNKVVEAYQKSSEAQMAKLTKSEDTALHLAVRDDHTDIVQNLVDSIPDNEASKKILEIKNEGGNTPLHLAAALGNVEMCLCIANKHPNLIRARNAESETPLFLAAHFGKQGAFLCLHELWEKEHAGDQELYYTPCRKSNGDTILHSAIYGEYFCLAYQIISYYPNLVNYVNENGLSPLHILANKPNVFRSSSSPLQLIDHIIYNCVFVGELKKESHRAIQTNLNKSKGGNSVRYPENYRTCIDFFKLLKVSFQVPTSKKKDESWKSSLLLCWEGFNHSLLADRCRKKTTSSSDEENPQRKSNVSQGKDILGNSSNAQRSGSRSAGKQARREDGGDHSFPPNYSICLLFFKLSMKTLLIVLGLGFGRIKKITEKKERHVWALQIMNELFERASTYKYDYNGGKPHESSMYKDGGGTEAPTSPLLINVHDVSTSTSTEYNSLAAREKKDQNLNLNLNGIEGTDKRDTPGSFAAKIGLNNAMDKFLNAYSDVLQGLNSAHKDLVLLTYEKKQMHDFGKRDTPLLIAAKMGISEMVEKILDTFPVAIQDLDSNKKNVVLLAVENRQSHVYDLLLKSSNLKESVFCQVDDQGNSALHLASMFGEHQPWLIPGAALQMQWEIKWYEFVKHSMPPQFFARYNKRGESPREIFTHTHQNLVKSGSKWLIKTSESCSVVAALIATVAFATSATVPGGVDDITGAPTLGSKPAFVAFSISSLIALCFSVTALVFFLAILTSRCQEKDFRRDLPRKLLLGLTSLYTSMASILVSFCCAHFFILNDTLKSAAFPVYALACLPVTFFGFAQLTLYFDLIRAIVAKVPQRSYKVFSQ